jgi:hypothetical protein
MPTAFMAEVSSWWLPCSSGVVGMNLHVPSSALIVPASAPSSHTVTLLPASAVPRMVGRVVLTSAPATGAITVGSSRGGPFTSTNCPPCMALVTTDRM